MVKRVGDKVVFDHNGMMYELGDHPYEPCTYIKLDGKTVCTLHNAFTVDDLPERLARGEKLRAINGREYDEAGFCRVLAWALESGRGDMDFPFAAGLRITPEMVSVLKKKEIFVFGSNLRGMHAGGAARVAAEKFGAVWGQGVGLQGRSYAIPTMQGGVETIRPYVDEFVSFASSHPELHFLVTRIGCGIAGFADGEIAPLFASAAALPNVSLPQSFWDYID